MIVLVRTNQTWSIRRANHRDFGGISSFSRRGQQYTRYFKRRWDTKLPVRGLQSLTRRKLFSSPYVGGSATHQTAPRYHRLLRGWIEHYILSMNTCTLSIIRIAPSTKGNLLVITPRGTISRHAPPHTNTMVSISGPGVGLFSHDRTLLL